MTPPILRVAVPVPIGDSFDYLWIRDGAAPGPGTRISVPFGRSRRIGVVVEIAAASGLPRDKLKPAGEPLDDEPLIGGELLDTLRWAADYYHHPIGEVLSQALPGLLRRGRPAEPKREVLWTLTRAGAAQDTGAVAARAARQALALTLLSRGPLSAAELHRGGVAAATLRRLADRGWARIAERAPATCSGRAAAAAAPPELTAEQRLALREIERHAGGYAAFVLHGATGSGKTEVFLRLIDRTLRSGRQALLLVPEIGLTPQLVARLRERFGERLALMHSGLGDSARLDAWHRARTGSAGIVVGTRSAVFAQLASPGLVIVDEEHDASFKQQQGFRYSARDLAVLRARRLDVPVVLASATPSLESFHNALSGRYRLLEMPTRIGAAGEPRVRVVDLNKHASRRALSTPLISLMEQHLAAGNQVLLFLNRRGFAPTLFCTQCRHVEECSRCDARLTVHAALGELRCHHCGTCRPLRWACPSCGAERVAVGAGTQRVTDELRTLFPDLSVGRLDRDATSRKGELDTVLAEAARGDTRILVGTQMLTKGHDFPRVTLVGVLNADQGLFGTEVRSDERLAQTIVQVAGRAGRRDTPGEVVIQTHYPEHPLLDCLLKQGYGAFARLALAERRRSGWPPFTHVAMWRAEAARRPVVFELLGRLRAAAAAAERPDVRVLGPAPDPMERKGGRYRGRLLFESASRAALHELLRLLLDDVAGWPLARRARWSVDVDPIDV